MDGDDKNYFLSRAEAELEQAQRASHPGAVRAHYHLANHYLDRVYGRKPETARPDLG
jgi:hypothetical protein